MPQPRRTSLQLQTTAKRLKSLKFCTLPAGAQPKNGDDAALTVLAERVVNPGRGKPAMWTWTRGGWRERYPSDFAQASRRPARSDCDRIRPYRRAHHHRDDGRPFRIGWGQRGDVGQDPAERD